MARIEGAQVTDGADATTAVVTGGAVDGIEVETTTFTPAGATLAAAGKFRKVLVVADATSGAVTAIQGADADSDALAVLPTVTAGKVALGSYTVDDTEVLSVSANGRGNVPYAGVEEAGTRVPGDANYGL